MRILALILSIVIQINVTSAQSSYFDCVLQGHENYRAQKFNESVLYFDSLFPDQNYFFMAFFAIFNKAVDGDSTAKIFLEHYENQGVKSSDLMHSINFFLKAKYSNDSESLIEDLIEDISIDSTCLSSLFYFTTYLEIEEINLETKKNIITSIIALNERIESSSKWILALKKTMKFYLKDELYKLGSLNYKDVIKVSLSSEDYANVRRFSILQDTNYFTPPFDIKKDIIELKMDSENSDTLIKYAFTIINLNPTIEESNWIIKTFAKKDIQFSWSKHVTANWRNFTGNKKINSYLDSITDSLQWIVLDVWGTWCKPCVAEMPELAEMSDKFNHIQNRPISFLTLARDSKEETETFMSKNGYSFPYLIVNDDDMKVCNVSSYPTTFLISPERRFTILPYTKDKQEAIKIFTQIDW